MKKVLISSVLFVSMVFVMSSCAPQTKESYMENYRQFITEVERDCEGYSEEDWYRADESFDKFRGEYYYLFEDEFDWKDEVVLAKYVVQYNLSKAKGVSKDFFDLYLNDDIDKMKEQVKYYLENEMDDDLEFLLEQAKEIGDSAVSIINEIVEELEIVKNE